MKREEREREREREREIRERSELITYIATFFT